MLHYPFCKMGLTLADILCNVQVTFTGYMFIFAHVLSTIVYPTSGLLHTAQVYCILLSLFVNDASVQKALLKPIIQVYLQICVEET